VASSQERLAKGEANTEARSAKGGAKSHTWVGKHAKNFDFSLKALRVNKRGRVSISSFAFDKDWNLLLLWPGVRKSLKVQKSRQGETFLCRILSPPKSALLPFLVNSMLGN
jgi:hypothetical protein